MPELLDPVMIHLTGWGGYKTFSIIWNWKFIKGLHNVYTIKHTKHKPDGPHGIDKNIVGIIISIFFSIILEIFFKEKVSL